MAPRTPSRAVPRLRSGPATRAEADGWRAGDCAFAAHQRELAAERRLVEALAMLELVFGCIPAEAAPVLRRQKAALKSIPIKA